MNFPLMMIVYSHKYTNNNYSCIVTNKDEYLKNINKGFRVANEKEMSELSVTLNEYPKLVCNGSWFSICDHQNEVNNYLYRGGVVAKQEQLSDIVSNSNEAYISIEEDNIINTAEIECLKVVANVKNQLDCLSFTFKDSYIQMLSDMILRQDANKAIKLQKLSDKILKDILSFHSLVDELENEIKDTSTKKKEH